MAPFTSYDHVQLAMPAGGETRAREFYVGTLGFEEVPKPESIASRGGLWLRSGAVNLHLGVDTDFHAAKKAHPALRCPGYHSLLDHLKRRGIETVEDEPLVDGSPHCYISDPFGNRIEIIAKE